MASLIGQTVSHYKILERLGAGGMGEVYKAVDTKLRRTVALKFLPASLTADPDAKERFIHEAQAASALDHPSICTIHEIGETDDGQLFIAMACYDGETLKKKIGRGPLAIDQAVDIAILIAQGLQEAHKYIMVHRDVEPANVLITASGAVKIVDFGLAKLAGSTLLTKSGSTVGTAAYMSPEQARGEKVDARTDIWSLGVVIFEMVTGQRPFKGEYDNALIYSILNAQPEPVTEIRAGMPLDLERIVVKCLAKDPAERYQHVQEVLADLCRLQTGSKGRATALARIRTGTMHRKLPKPWMWLAIVVLMAVLVLAGYFFLNWSRDNTEAGFEWQNSVAVLPLKNLSSDPEQDYFCDGMTEQLLTNLSKLQGLKVIASQSAMKLRNSEKTFQEIGAELGVAYLLKGSVRKSGGKIRTAVQLVKAQDGYQVWAEDYSGELKDVFLVQDSVSQTIANELLKRLSVKEASDIKMKRPRSIGAYDYFLKASYLSERFDHTIQFEDYRNAEVMFKKALELDPGYAPSYAGLAYLYINYLAYSRTLTEEERSKIIRSWKECANTALRLDPQLVEAYLVQVPFWQLENMKKALEINPNHVGALLKFGYYLRNNGLIYQSIKYFDRAQELNPLHPWAYAARGLSYWYLGETGTAIQEYERALQIEPNDNITQLVYIQALISVKRTEEAEQRLLRYNSMWPEGSSEGDPRATEAWLFAAKGDKVGAFENFAKRRQINNTWYETVFYSLLGMKDQGIELLEKRQKNEMNDLTCSRYLELAHCPAYDGLRDDIRFREILAKEKEKYALVLKHYGM